MKLKYIALILIALTSLIHSQSDQWAYFVRRSPVRCQASDGKYQWIGTERYLSRLNTSTGDKEIFYSGRFISFITIDRQGNKWIGVVGVGLVKYDGKTWTEYTKFNSGLPSNYLSAFAIDENDNKWIATNDTGLVKYDGQNWTIYKAPDSKIPVTSITSILFDRWGNIWLGVYNKGVLKFDGQNWTFYDRTNSVLGYYGFNSIVMDSRGDIFIEASNRVYRYDGQNWSLFYTPGSGSSIISIFIDGQDMWVVTSMGPIKYDGKIWTKFTDPVSGSQFGGTTSMYIDKQGNKWIGNGLGLIKCDSISSSYWTYWNFDFKPDLIKSISIDKKGNIWACGCLRTRQSSDVLLKYDGHTWYEYSPVNYGLSDRQFGKMIIDKYDDFWITAPDLGIVKFDGRTFTNFTSLDSGLPNNSEVDIQADPQGNKWFASQGGGVIKYDGKTWTVFNSSNSPLPSNYVKGIAIDRQGNKWIGTWLGGLVKYDDKNWTVYNTSPAGLQNSSVRPLGADPKGNVWLSTDYGGFSKFDGKDWTVYETPRDWNSPYGSYYYDITADNQENLWLLSGSGLSKFDGKNWTAYNFYDFGFYATTLSFAIDRFGNKWLGLMDYGIAVFNENGITFTGDNNNTPVPDHFVLEQNYPNPFNPSTTISYSIPAPSHVELKIYDIIGREIKTLVTTYQDAGKYKVDFNASSFPSGVYIYSLRAGEYVSSRKLMILK